jgi:hypothetical protein
MTNVAGQIGYIYGAYLWPKSNGPRYGIGFGTSAAFCLLGIIAAWGMKIMLKNENRSLKANSTGSNVNYYGY